MKKNIVKLQQKRKFCVVAMRIVGLYNYTGRYLCLMAVQSYYDLDPIQAQGHGASKFPKIFRKLHFSTSISSAILACSSKVIVRHDSMGSSVQRV